FSPSRIGQIPALEHEAVNDPLEDLSGVQRLMLPFAIPGIVPLAISRLEAHEVLYGFRGVLGHQADRERPLVRHERGGGHGRLLGRWKAASLTERRTGRSVQLVR